LSQNKWTGLNQECDGNIDAFSFVFWDHSGEKRVDYAPASAEGRVVADIPSGLRAWTAFRGYESEVFSQLTEFNPTIPAGKGFTFEELAAEIDAGYPVLLYLQKFDQLSRSLPGMPQANPEMHGMLAHGYYIADSGDRFVRYKTSWGSSGDNTLSKWGPGAWQAQLPVRGVIGFHPRPQLTRIAATNGVVNLEWDGPSATLSNLVDRSTIPVHWYVVERASTLDPANFAPVSEPTVERAAMLTNCCTDVNAFYRLRLLTAAERPGASN
jgi:hypothetical protein